MWLCVDMGGCIIYNLLSVSLLWTYPRFAPSLHACLPACLSASTISQYLSPLLLGLRPSHSHLSCWPPPFQAPTTWYTNNFTNLAHRIPYPMATQALDNAGLEFERDYLPDLQRRVAQAKARQEAAKQVR